MPVKNPYGSLRDMVASWEDDFSKFYDKGNNAAGTRVRKYMKELRDKAQEVRLGVQNIKNDGAEKKPATAVKKAPPKKKA
jgi:hypothetical protein